MNATSLKQKSARITTPKVRHLPRLMPSVSPLVSHYDGEVLPAIVAGTEENLRDLSSYLIAAQEEERARIARELHDDLSQRMALLLIGFDQLMPQLSDAAQRAQLGTLANAADEISTELHNISHQLHPAKLEALGLVAALSSHCRELSSRHGLQVRFEQHDVPGQLPPDVSLCLYRILQEALRNVLKHSGAAKATVILRGCPVGIELSVSDAGKGFTMRPRRTGGGLGLVSIEERLRLVNGQLTIESAPSRGTRISAWVPLPKAHGEAADDLMDRRQKQRMLRQI